MVVGALVIGSIALVPLGTATATEDRWEPVADLPAPRQEVAAVAVGGRILVAGGLGTGLEIFSDRHEAFDPATGAWSALAPLPQPAHHLQGVRVGRLVYYLGGLRGLPFVATGEVWAYDPTADSFATRKALPAGRERGAGGVAVHGGKVYLAGGQREGEATAQFDVYDPETDTWSVLPDLPTPREHLGAAFVGDVLYLIGGRAAGGGITRTDAFDLSAGRWIADLAPIPGPRGGLAVTALGGEIYALGGEGGGVAHPEVEAYDPAADTWRALPPMPTPRHGIQAPALGGGLWVAGGATDEGFQPSNANEVLFPADPAPAVLSALRVSPRIVTAGRRSRIAYRLSDPVRVRITVERGRSGKFERIPGAISDRGEAGRNRLAFRGRVGGTRLVPGRYRLSARPREPGAERRRTEFSVRR